MPVERLTYRPTEAAEALGLSRSKVYDLVARGELPSVRLGGVVRIPVVALEKWLAARMAEADL